MTTPRKKRRLAKPPVKVTDEQIALAIKASAGNVKDMSKLLNVAMRTIELRIHASAELLRLQREVVNDVIAIAEASLIRILRDPAATDHAKAVMFTLRTKGRKLGYSERVELAGAADGKPVQVQFFVPQKEDDEE